MPGTSFTSSKHGPVAHAGGLCSGEVARWGREEIRGLCKQFVICVGDIAVINVKYWQCSTIKLLYARYSSEIFSYNRLYKQEGFLRCQTPTSTVRLKIEGCRLK